MDYQTGFFYLFAFVLLFAAFRVVTARNPVHAVLFLMLAFSQASGLWLLLQAEFLGLTLVLVYLGAVMVLFLFVVMMLDIKLDSGPMGFLAELAARAVAGGPGGGRNHCRALDGLPHGSFPCCCCSRL